jgi:voltage-gated potassium channel Kch
VPVNYTRRYNAPVDRLDSRSLRQRLQLPLALVGAVIVIGTSGYYLLWRAGGGTWLDALFMTVTTITTIGYGEVRPLTRIGRVFTMALAFVGIGSGNRQLVLHARRLDGVPRTAEQLAQLEQLVGRETAS